jgi:hypothetical protein
MTLGDRIAGVALNSGGLVRCGSTPACSFRAGSIAECARYPAMNGWCRCDERPLPMAVLTTTPKIPFVLSHGTNDPDVSVAYTCALAGDLQRAGFPVTLHLRAGDGHFCDGDFVDRSWHHLSSARVL